jgi:hypothetical protein
MGCSVSEEEEEEQWVGNCESDFQELYLTMKTLKQDTCYTWDKLTVCLAEGESKARFDLAAHSSF